VSALPAWDQSAALPGSPGSTRARTSANLLRALRRKRPQSAPSHNPTAPTQQGANASGDDSSDRKQLPDKQGLATQGFLSVQQLHFSSDSTWKGTPGSQVTATRRRVGIESARRVTAARRARQPAGVCCKCELWRGEGLGTRNGRVLPKDIAESSYLESLGWPAAVSESQAALGASKPRRGRARSRFKSPPVLSRPFRWATEKLCCGRISKPQTSQVAMTCWLRPNLSATSQK